MCSVVLYGIEFIFIFISLSTYLLIISVSGSVFTLLFFSVFLSLVSEAFAFSYRRRVRTAKGNFSYDLTPEESCPSLLCLL